MEIAAVCSDRWPCGITDEYSPVGLDTSNGAIICSAMIGFATAVDGYRGRPISIVGVGNGVD